MGTILILREYILIPVETLLLKAVIVDNKDTKSIVLKVRLMFAQQEAISNYNKNLSYTLERLFDFACNYIHTVSGP